MQNEQHNIFLPNAGEEPPAEGGVVADAPSAAEENSAPEAQVTDATPQAETPPQSTPTQSTPDPEPTFRMPGQRGQESDAEWYRQSYAQAMQQLTAERRLREELELKGLSEEEREREIFKRQQQEFQAQMQQFQRQQEINQWREYVGQFVDPAEVKQFNDPTDMVHYTITSQARRLAAAEKELAALREAVKKQEPGPRVTTGTGQQVTRSLFDLSREEREALYRKARMGELDPNEISFA